MRTITISLPTIEQVEFKIIQHDEHIPIRGNALASGDDKEDKKEEDRITRALNRGNLWAWCAVEVVGTYKGISASDFLGGCSYRNENDFKKGGYYDDMKSVCFNSIIEQLKNLA